MTCRKTLLAASALVGLFACQNAATDQDQCTGKCDGLGNESSGGKLMPRAPSTPGTISITRNGDSWFCEVIGDRGEILLLSEAYASRTSALSGALSIEENGVLADRYSVEQTGAGAWAFALRAGNSELLADSQTFATEAEAEEAAASARDLLAGIVQYKAALTGGARFELHRQDGDWEFELFDAAERSVLVSQIYSGRRDAITGILSVRENGKDEARYQLLDSPPRFILKAANGEEIAESSATFASQEEAQAAVSSVQTLLTSERVANPW